MDIYVYVQVILSSKYFILTIKNTIHTQFTNVINQHKKNPQTNSLKNLFFNNIYVVQEQNKI